MGRLGLQWGWVCVAIGLIWSQSVLAQQGPAPTDYDQALQKAKAENKRVLLYFSGRDWNPFCVKLEREVLQTPEFQRYLQNNLLFVELDYSVRTLQTDAIKKQNLELAAKYRIRSYPTVIMVDGEGKEWGRLGYIAGGPIPYIDQLSKFKAPPKEEKKDEKKAEQPAASLPAKL